MFVCPTSGKLLLLRKTDDFEWNSDNVISCRYDVHASQIQVLEELGFNWTEIASVLCVSPRTLYNHRARLGLIGQPFNNPSDQALDALILEVLSNTPNVGETYICGSLRGRGLRIQRRRIRERIQVLDPVGRAIRRRQAIRRRIYNIRTPNELW